MVRVLVIAEIDGADMKIGTFDYEHLPRAGEDVWTPAPGTEQGNRIFTVGGVTHIPATVETAWGQGPLTILHDCMEIG